jgi:hypothetical protein
MGMEWSYMLVANSISIKSQPSPYNTQNMQQASLMNGINSKKRKGKAGTRKTERYLNRYIRFLTTYLSTYYSQWRL